MQPLAQPPRKSDGRFDDWMFRLWKRISDTAGIAWALVDKTGSNLTDIETRNHADLQNINTASYTHLTAINATDLTDGGETALHKHDHSLQDNLNSANYTHLTATNATDLTDGGDTTLHYHQKDRVSQNTIDTTLEIEVDTSYIVSSYLNINSDLTITGNLEVL